MYYARVKAMPQFRLGGRAREQGIMGQGRGGKGIQLGLRKDGTGDERG